MLAADIELADIVSKTEFADIHGVSKARISHGIAKKKLQGDTRAGGVRFVALPAMWF